MTQAGIPSEEEVFEYVNTLSNWGSGARTTSWAPSTTSGRSIEERLQRWSGTGCRCPAQGLSPTNAPGLQLRSHPLHDTLRRGVRQPAGDLPACPAGKRRLHWPCVHGFSITHIDSLCHIFWNGKMYNGQSSALITSSEGATAESIELLQDGVVSRGVLLDAPVTGA